MSIHFTCESCGKRLKAPDDAEGMRVLCPGCGASVPVSEGVYDAEAIEEPAVPEVTAADASAGYALTEPEPATAPEEKRRPCPACGEMIVARAVKCRYCGEIFDETLRKAEQKKLRARAGDSDLSAGEWVVAILCSGIGCIVGVVYLIQGKPKGGKMLGVSILFTVLWNVFRFAIEAALQH